MGKPGIEFYTLYNADTLSVIASNMEAECMPEKGDIVAMKDKETGKITFYRVTGFLHMPSEYGFYYMQPLGRKIDKLVDAMP